MTNNERLFIALHLVQAFGAEGKTVTNLHMDEEGVYFNCLPFFFGYNFRTKNYSWVASTLVKHEPLPDTIINIIKIL